VATRSRPSLALRRGDALGLLPNVAPKGQVCADMDFPPAANPPTVSRSARSSRKIPQHHLFEHQENLVQRITVLIADDDALLRQGLRLFLALQEDIRVVGEVSEGPQALGIAEALSPDILLLGVQMLKASGLQFLFDMRVKSPKAKVLIFSGMPEDSFMLEALQQGAMGYLLKTATQTDLIKAIRSTCAGEIWAQRRVLTQVLEHMRRKISELQEHSVEQGENLTEREREIVHWVMQGMTNKEIAIRLGISEKTVKSHLHSDFGKLKVTRRYQLIRLMSGTPAN
jgi:DNA-binding NarL/FixJ family response regulator